jgi:hypothetical protein
MQVAGFGFQATGFKLQVISFIWGTALLTAFYLKATDIKPFQGF